jgi:pyruvate,water dikinase
VNKADVILLADILEADAASVGPKATSLARMNRLGLPVPRAFCIRGAAYRGHLRANGLIDTIAASIDSLDRATPQQARDALARVRQAIVEAPLSESLRAEIERRYDELGAERVAVRSSATAEDLPGHSFAGQYDTHLDVTDLPTCLDTVKKCWASLWTYRAYEYRSRAGIGRLDVDMAVIVQELVAADASGVAFTADPVTADTNRLIVEACLGLGDALVSGAVTPDRFVLDKAGLDIVSRSIAGKTACDESTTPSVDDKTVRQVAELALKAEDAFDAPQDIEWAIAGDDLYLLQSRPITALPAAQSPEDRHVWTTANTGEVLPDVVTPLTWSMVEMFVPQLFNAILGGLGLDLGDTPLIRRIGGRGYFSLNTVAAIIRCFPGLGKKDVTRIFGGGQASSKVARMFGSVQAGSAELVDLDIPDEDIPRLDFSLLRLAIRMPLFTVRFLFASSRRGERVVADLRARADALRRADMRSPSDSELAERMRAGLDALGRTIPDVALGGFSMLFFTVLDRECRKWFGEWGESAANRLLSGMGGIESAEAGLDMWRLAVAAHERPGVERAVLSDGEWKAVREKVAAAEGGDAFLARWAEFMDEHGHHTRGEIELSNPRRAETPDYILTAVRAYLARIDETDPLENHRRRAEERTALAAECRRRLNPIRRALFSFYLGQAQRGSRVRENLKSAVVRYIAASRALVLEIGDRLASRGVVAHGDDIFFLTIDEADSLARGGSDAGVKERIAQRRAEYDACLTITPPAVVFGRFDPAEHVAHATDTGAALLKGLPVSPGFVVGRARVILRTDADEHVLPGEILVAPFTDPGWTPYFLPAAAIVVDQGGLLSHGSIVAREYGIPAVVNVGPATTRIRTGQTIEVDGTRGTVRILE